MPSMRGPRVPVRQQFGAGGLYHRHVTARVVAVLVGVEHLGDVPATVLRPREAFLEVERIDGERLAGFPGKRSGS